MHGDLTVCGKSHLSLGCWGAWGLAPVPNNRGLAGLEGTAALSRAALSKLACRERRLVTYSHAKCDGLSILRSDRGEPQHKIRYAGELAVTYHIVAAGWGC